MRFSLLPVGIAALFVVTSRTADNFDTEGHGRHGIGRYIRQTQYDNLSVQLLR